MITKVFVRKILQPRLAVKPYIIKELFNALLSVDVSQMGMAIIFNFFTKVGARRAVSEPVVDFQLYILAIKFGHCRNFRPESCDLIFELSLFRIPDCLGYRIDG